MLMFFKTSWKDESVLCVVAVDVPYKFDMYKQYYFKPVYQLFLGSESNCTHKHLHRKFQLDVSIWISLQCNISSTEYASSISITEASTGGVL